MAKEYELHWGSLCKGCQNDIPGIDESWTFQPDIQDEDMKGFREIKKKPRKIDIIKEQDAVIKLLAFERDYYKKQLEDIISLTEKHELEDKWYTSL